MTWKQAAFIITINAVLSFVISLAVVMWLSPHFPARVTETPIARIPTPAWGFVTATATPANLVVHVVQPGENLSLIAFHYGVPMEDIIRVNRLTNPDFLRAGQELIIPAEGVPLTPLLPTDTPIPIEVKDTPTSTATPSAISSPSSSPTMTPGALPSFTELPLVPTSLPTTTTATSTLTPTPLESPRLRIADLVGSAVGQPFDEVVLLLNDGRGVDMTGWRLISGDGGVFTFPDGFFLFPGGSINIHTRSGKDTAVDLFWGRDGTMWGPPGSTISLVDKENNVMAIYQR